VCVLGAAEDSVECGDVGRGQEGEGYVAPDDGKGG